MSEEPSFWERFTWEPAWDQCYYHSSWKTQVPALYEAWLETKGEMVDEEYPPECVRHAVCADCAAYLRERPSDDMTLLVLRLLKG